MNKANPVGIIFSEIQNNNVIEAFILNKLSLVLLSLMFFPKTGVAFPCQISEVKQGFLGSSAHLSVKTVVRAAEHSATVIRFI